MGASRAVVMATVLSACGQGNAHDGRNGEPLPAFAQVPATCWTSGYRYSDVRFCRRPILDGHFLIEFATQVTDTHLSMGAIQMIGALPGHGQGLRYARYTGEGNASNLLQSDRVNWDDGGPVSVEMGEYNEAVSDAFEAPVARTPCLVPLNYLEGACEDIFDLDRSFSQVANRVDLVSWGEFADGAEPSQQLSSFTALANKCWRADFHRDDVLGVYCFDVLFDGGVIRLSYSTFDRQERVDGEVFYHWDNADMAIRYRSYNSRGQSEQTNAVTQRGSILLPGAAVGAGAGEEGDHHLALAWHPDDDNQLILAQPQANSSSETMAVGSFWEIGRAEAEQRLAQ